MKILNKTILPLLFFCFCSHAMAVLQCPSKNFNTFFNLFSEKKDLQKRFTENPMLYSSVIPSVDGHELVTELVLKDDVKEFPLVKSKAQRKRDGNVLVELERVPGSTRAKAILYNQDTGYYLNYWFILKKDCWYLMHYENRTF